MFDWVLNTSFEMRMEIYQKNTRFDFIHKRLLGRILGPHQFEYEINIRNTKRRMSGSIHIGNTYNYWKRIESKAYIFYPRQLFEPWQNFVNPRHSKSKFYGPTKFQPMPKFYEPTPPTPSTPKFDHTTHEPTLPTRNREEGKGGG